MINGFSSELLYFCILSRTFICVNNVLHFLMKFIIKDAKWQKYGKKKQLRRVGIKQPCLMRKDKVNRSIRFEPVTKQSK